jgi:decaprenylphospho-beta-D-erythro-pentofuranosid-2-ulose 2-reductase
MLLTQAVQGARPEWMSRLHRSSECLVIQTETRTGLRLQPERGACTPTSSHAVSAITWLGDYFAQRHAGTLAVLSSVAGDRGRKSNYIYGASKAGLSVFVDGLRNRIDREGVRVMTIKPGPVRTAMTESMKGSEKFADVEKVAATLVKEIDKGTDVVYVPGIWRLIMTVVRAIPEQVFKKLNL